ncbi:MAG TPA: inositol monophosphatase family protein [Myxococcales bacterium LLY-WYZ-16_1]|nr:inositol monophosphatase family protein [Myxococcales bacterium LLY-WYZ-16_1]
MRSVRQPFLDAMLTGAKAAGDVARRLQGKVPRERKRGPTDEAEALTAVDLAAQDLLLRLLARDLPQVAVDAEEDTDTLGLLPHREEPDRPLVVLDPLDGTAAYADGSARYGVMAGLIEGGHFQAAVLHFPAWALTVWTDGERVQREGALPPREADVLVTPWMPRPVRRALRQAGFEVQGSRCSAVDGVAPVLGVADASVCDGCADRRRAIALFVSHAAGYPVWLGKGLWRGQDPEGCRQAFGLVARDPVMLQSLRERVETTLNGAGR